MRCGVLSDAIVQYLAALCRTDNTFVKPPSLYCYFSCFLILSFSVHELQRIESLQPLVISTKNLLLENTRLANFNIMKLKLGQTKGIGFKVR